MRSFISIVAIIFSAYAVTATCDITAEYRCRTGRAGTVSGTGETLDAAKIHARDRARDICGGRIDYVRFIDASATC